MILVARWYAFNTFTWHSGCPFSPVGRPHQVAGLSHFSNFPRNLIRTFAASGWHCRGSSTRTSSSSLNSRCLAVLSCQVFIFVWSLLQLLHAISRDSSIRAWNCWTYWRRFRLLWGSQLHASLIRLSGPLTRCPNTSSFGEKPKLSWGTSHTAKSKNDTLSQSRECSRHYPRSMVFSVPWNLTNLHCSEYEQPPTNTGSAEIHKT